ncbi:MAG: hypothetical protein ACK5TR_00670 [Alphaproteobacteria bacterium]|jgi:hypothetical protein|nr:hypothetical protein [Alphaproteobacteria bacterium]
MKIKAIVNILALIWLSTAIASSNDWEGTREDVVVRLKNKEAHMELGELCALFKPISHPQVYALFEEGFGLLFRSQEGRLPPKRENSHIACLYDGFRAVFESEAFPTLSDEVKECQKIQLIARFDLKGHKEKFTEAFLEKLQ